MIPSLLARLVTAPSRLYYGWRIVALSGLVNAIAGGVYQYGFGIFFLPISRDLGLTRAQTSLVFSLSRAEGAIEGPLAGWLVDRYGPKYVLIGGAILTGIGYVVLAWADSFLSFLLIYLLFISLSFNAGFGHSTLAAVNTWFVRRRGFAMAVVSSAFSVGGAIVSPILGIVVAFYGWRIGAILAGVALVLIVVPAALKLKRSPESMGLLPDGDTEPPTAEQAKATELRDFSVREGLRTKEFWILAIATTLRLSVVNVVTIQFVPLMVWKGIDELTGAFLLATLATLTMPFRIGLGWLGDRVQKNYLLGIGMWAGAAAYVLLQYAQELWQIWLFVGLYAMVEGINPLNWALIGDYYGRKSFATLRGTMGLIYTWGTALAPVLAGAVFDATNSYELVLWGMTASYFVGALVFFSLRAPAPPDRVSNEPVGAAL